MSIKSPSRDDAGRYSQSREGGALSAYSRSEEAYDAVEGTYDVQELSYAALESYDSADLARDNAQATYIKQVSGFFGQTINLPDIETKFEQEVRFMDDRWVATTDAAVQRYLDLMNDKSGKVTGDDKLALLRASLATIESSENSRYTETEAKKSKAFNSFESLVQEYLSKGTTRAAIAPEERWGDRNNENKNVHWGDALRRREGVDKMITEMGKVTSKFQPPVPGKKEADALLKQVWSGELNEGARDRFDTSALLFVG